MKKNSTPLLIFGIGTALLFAISVFAKINRTTATGSVPHHEVSTSAELSVDFDSHRHYLFTSSSCPHCANVANFLAAESTVEAAVDLVRVPTDNGNTRFGEQLTNVAKECGLNAKEGIGIPLLYINDQTVPANRRCLQGDEPIIAYLSQLTATGTTWGGQVERETHQQLLWYSVGGLIIAGAAWYVIDSRHRST